MLRKIRHYLFSIYYLALVFVLCFCKKDSQYTKGLETNADGVEAYVEALNENIKNLQQLVQLYSNGQSLITRFDYDKKEDSYRFTFTSGEVLRFSNMKTFPDFDCPLVSVVLDDSVYLWTINDDLARDGEKHPIEVNGSNCLPQLKFSDGTWYWQTNTIDYYTITNTKKESKPFFCFETDEGCIILVLPTECAFILPIYDEITNVCAYIPNKAFYKNVFLDAGIGLTSRKNLAAVTHLGLSLECMSFSSQADKELQNQIVEGETTDLNGRLLYPDWQPRYQLLFVNGGNAKTHAKSLTEGARRNMQQFNWSGGSYIGTCAGAFFASYGAYGPTINADYLNIWPQFVRRTHLSQTQTGFIIEPNSPLLDYYDFGGDMYVGNVRHNGGCFPMDLPQNGEVLARYDYPELDSMHLQPSAWAYKNGPFMGRVIQIGSHPEEVSTGERRDFTAASVLYAIDGCGKTKTKGVLQNGVGRFMNKSTEDKDPDYTMIGDLQCHHFCVYIPKNASDIIFKLQCDWDVDFSLMINKGSAAYEESAQYVSSAVGANKTLRFSKLSSGWWYVGVKCNTTVTISETDWGQEYTGRTDVLNGVPYSIKVNWSTLVEQSYLNKK